MALTIDPSGVLLDARATVNSPISIPPVVKFVQKIVAFLVICCILSHPPDAEPHERKGSCVTRFSP
jgi:hypothetical protein